MTRLLLALCAAACAPIAPPPLVLRHQTTAPLPERTVLLSWIVGGWTQGFHAGIGTEVRVVVQATEQVLVGLGIGGGRGALGRSLLCARAFGAWSPGEDWVAVTGGVGVNGLDTGYVALTLDAGLAASRAGGDVHPHGAVFGAVSLPLRLGEPFGWVDEPPSTFLHTGASLGTVVDVADRNSASLELGGAWSWEPGGRLRGASVSLSLADSQVVAQPSSSESSTFQ